MGFKEQSTEECRLTIPGKVAPRLAIMRKGSFLTEMGGLIPDFAFRRARPECSTQAFGAHSAANSTMQAPRLGKAICKGIALLLILPSSVRPVSSVR